MVIAGQNEGVIGDGTGRVCSNVAEILLERAAPGGTFHSDVSVIGLHTQLKAPEAGRYRISMEKRSAILESEGRKFVLPDQIRATIDHMCKRKSFRPGELSGPLDNDGKLSLARYLHGERFLTLVD